METVLRTQGLCKHYRRFKALDGLDMEVPKGAIYGLVGKNGAGKTTLIRVICGLQRPSGGSYSLYGAGAGRAPAEPDSPAHGRGGGDSLPVPGHDGEAKPEAAIPGAGAAG